MITLNRLTEIGKLSLKHHATHLRKGAKDAPEGILTAALAKQIGITEKEAKEILAFTATMKVSPSQVPVGRRH